MTTYKYHGYDGYTVRRLYSSNFVNNRWNQHVSMVGTYGNDFFYIYPVTDREAVLNRTLRIQMEEHPELLDTAKKLYIHPDCDISREAVRRKYKKCLNMVSADAIIVPGFNGTSDLNDHTAVFINDDLKTIVFTTFWTSSDEDAQSYTRICKYPLGTPFHELASPSIQADLENHPGIRNAKLSYIGATTFFGRKQQYLVDYITYMLPKDKLVSQETLMKTLGDETNVPTYDSMMSIYEMLNSNEESIRNLGLKTLASIDYSNFPKSTIFILKHTNWPYTSVRNTTAVKYMLKALGVHNSSYHRYIGYDDNYISLEDYALFEKLARKIEKIEDNVHYLRYCYDLPFVRIDESFQIHPRVR